MPNSIKDKIEQKLEQLFPEKANARDRYKNRPRKQSNRENFLQFFERTAEKVFIYSYEYSRNQKDAEHIMREAYVYMHDHIGELRSAKTVDSWQRSCVEKAFKALLRSQLLERTEDGSNLPKTYKLDPSRRTDMWKNITAFTEIDPWRLVPIPQKSTIFSVLADQTISDLRYMAIGDILSSVAIILIGAVIVVAGLYFGIKLIKQYSEEKTDTMQEIYLDSDYYGDYDMTDADELSREKLDEVLADGAKYELDEEGKQIVIPAPKSIGNTAGTPVYTGYEEVDEKLRGIISEVIKDDMSDPEKVWALYKYVGTTLVYSRYEGRGEDKESILLDTLEFKSGTSLHYAHLFSALANAAGYRCEVVTGRFILNRDTEFETQAEHYWNRMSLNGVVYFLDVEADVDANGTEMRDYYFMAADGNERWNLFERDHE